MAKLYNLARVNTATTGTGTITLGTAVAGFLTFAGAGVANGDTVAYGIQDGNNSEVGTGVYTASGTTLTRSVTSSTNGNAAISLSGTAQVFVIARAQDILNPASNLLDVASAKTSRVNLNVETSSQTLPGDANYTILPTDRLVALAVGLTAPRTWTLPTAASVNAGSRLVIKDYGGITGANTITLTRGTGGDVLNVNGNAVASYTMIFAGMSVELVSDGSANWSLEPQHPYVPVQQGTGAGQLSNLVKIGWSGSALKATVDSTDLGDILTTTAGHKPPVFSVNVQTLTASGTYTPTAGMKYCIIECWGAGGGGGGTNNSAASAFGGCGGAGSYSRKFASAATIGASQTVTIGTHGSGGASGNNNGTAGGDTSVGTICVGKGGGAGAGQAATTTGTTAAGGAGGVAGTGDIAQPGEAGDPGNTQAGGPPSWPSYHGGNAPPVGYGGKVSVPVQTATGQAGQGKASGGAGGQSFNNVGGAAGGNGADGYVVITEFIYA